MAELLSSFPVVPLTAGMVLRFDAIDPDTGAQVPDVVLSKVTIYGLNLLAEDEITLGPFIYVPGAGEV